MDYTRMTHLLAYVLTQLGNTAVTAYSLAAIETRQETTMSHRDLLKPGTPTRLAGIAVVIVGKGQR